MPQPDKPRLSLSLFTEPLLTEEERSILQAPSLQALALERLVQAEKLLVVSTTVIPPKLLEITKDIEQATAEYDEQFGGKAIVQGIPLDEGKAHEAQQRLISLGSKQHDITIFGDTRQSIHEHFEAIRQALRRSIELFGPIEIPTEIVQELVGRRVRSTVDALSALGDLLELVATKTALADTAEPEGEVFAPPRPLGISKVIELPVSPGRKKRERTHAIVMPDANDGFTSWMQVTGIPHPPMKDSKAIHTYYALMQNFRVALDKLAKKVPSFYAYLEEEPTEVTTFQMILHLHTLTALDLVAFKPEAKQARSDTGIAPVSRLLFLLHRDMLRREKGTDVTKSDIGTPEAFRELAKRILNAEVVDSDNSDIPLVESLITEFLKDPNARPHIIIHASMNDAHTIFRLPLHQEPLPIELPKTADTEGIHAIPTITLDGLSKGLKPKPLLAPTARIPDQIPSREDTTAYRFALECILKYARKELKKKLYRFSEGNKNYSIPAAGLNGSQFDNLLRNIPHHKLIKLEAVVSPTGPTVKGDARWTETDILLLIIAHELESRGKGSVKKHVIDDIRKIIV